MGALINWLILYGSSLWGGFRRNGPLNGMFVAMALPPIIN